MYWVILEDFKLYLNGIMLMYSVATCFFFSVRFFSKTQSCV